MKRRDAAGRIDSALFGLALLIALVVAAGAVLSWIWLDQTTSAEHEEDHILLVKPQLDETPPFFDEQNTNALKGPSSTTVRAHSPTARGTTSPQRVPYADDPYFSMDLEYVYSYGQIVPRADPTSFVLLNTIYSKDNDQVYYGREDIIPIPLADTTTFEVFDPDRRVEFFDADDMASYAWRQSYARDANYVYYHGNPIANADPESFTLLGLYYAKDSINIYFVESLVPDADIHSFEVITDDATIDGRDKSHGYNHGQIVREQ